MEQKAPKYYTLQNNTDKLARWGDPTGEGTSPEFTTYLRTYGASKVYFSAGWTVKVPMPNPIHVALLPIGPGMGKYLPEILRGPNSLPLFRNDLLEAVQEIGIDNLQLYPAVVHDPEYKTEYTNYTGVNIVGLVDIVNKKKVEWEGDIMTNVELDEEAPNTLLMFRIADPDGMGSSTIIVHRKVKEHLEAKGFDLEFYETDEVAM